MKTVKFTYYPEYGGYKCSDPGEGTGTYVLASEAEAAVNQANADWVERCRKFRKQDADEAQERERVLVEALDRVTAYYEGCMQGIKTDNYQDVIDQARAALAAKE